MSSVFDFNGAPGSGWSQPEPIRENAGKNIPDSIRRNTLHDGREPASQNSSATIPSYRRGILVSIQDSIHWDLAR